MAFADGQPAGRGRGERGGAAVEFAIVLPLLVLVLFGIVEFSIIMYDQALITSASREGARFGAVFQPNPRPTCNGINGNSGPVQAYKQGLIAIAGAKTINTACFRNGTQVTNLDDPLCTAPGVALGVQTSFAYSYALVPGFISKTLTLRSATVMRCE